MSVRKLQGHRAVVTGASSGIGEAFARQLASMGCNLVVVARRKDRLEKLADELRSQYAVDVECIELDLVTPGASRLLFDQATAQKDVTILVSNAGIGKYGNFDDFHLDHHLATLQLNSVVPTELTFYFLAHMRAHGKKSYIAYVASIAAFQPTGYFTVYSGTKGYMRYFSETLGFELRNSNVSVSCICPGGTYTEFLDHAGQKLTSSGRITMMTPEDVVRGSVKAILRGRSVYIPGVMNKIACFLPRLLPRGWSLFFAFLTMNQVVQRENSCKTQ